MSLPGYFSGPELVDWLDWLGEHHPGFPRPVYARLHGEGRPSFLSPDFPLHGEDGFAQFISLPEVGLYYPFYFPTQFDSRAEYWKWFLYSLVAHLIYMDLQWNERTSFTTSTCRRLEPQPPRNNKREDDWTPPCKKHRLIL